MSILEADAEQASGRQYYAESQQGKRFFILVLVLALLAAALLSLVLGAADIGMQDLLALISGKAEGYRAAARAHILMDIRLPRLVLALIAGTGLAISGTVMQAVLRNPLASSYTLGVSSGAGFGAALAIGLGMGIWGGKYIVVANAFVFGMASMFLVYRIASIRGAGPGMLILAGIAVNYFFSALIAVIKYMVADHDALAGIVFWLMGGLNLANWEKRRYWS